MSSLSELSVSSLSELSVSSLSELSVSPLSSTHKYQHNQTSTVKIVSLKVRISCSTVYCIMYICMTITCLIISKVLTFLAH